VTGGVCQGGWWGERGGGDEKGGEEVSRKRKEEGEEGRKEREGRGGRLVLVNLNPNDTYIQVRSFLGMQPNSQKIAGK